MSERIVVSRDAFLTTAPAVKRVDVPVPEFGEGCVIPVWQWTARERSDFELSNKSEGPGANIRSVRERLIVSVCRNDDGTRMFSAADVVKLASHPCDIVERIVEAAKKLNTVTDSDIEDIAKNSEATDADS